MWVHPLQPLIKLPLKLPCQITIFEKLNTLSSFSLSEQTVAIPVFRPQIILVVFQDAVLSVVCRVIVPPPPPNCI